MFPDSEYISYFRSDIDAMSGYQPGEQLNLPDLLKLNTNESPYPPAPGVGEFLRTGDYSHLRLYPNPNSDPVRDELANCLGLERSQIICGNGSDDILNIIIRCFSSPSLPIACLRPSYTLYPTLAQLNGAPIRFVDLTEDFRLPDTETILKSASDANILILTRPNAPTGNTFPLSEIEAVCAGFRGIVLVDEAYTDFAEDSCMTLFGKYPNLILSRTFSKSRALAGLRFGYAAAHPRIIEGLLKMKDSYNVSYLTQMLAVASLRDHEYFKDCVAKIRSSREKLLQGLLKLGFSVVPSSTNFLFAMPPDSNGERCFLELRKKNILVRYFAGAITGKYVRITVGTDADVDRLLKTLEGIYRS